MPVGEGYCQSLALDWGLEIVCSGFCAFWLLAAPWDCVQHLLEQPKGRFPVHLLSIQFVVSFETAGDSKFHHRPSRCWLIYQAFEPPY